MSLEAKRSRHVAVAIPEVRLSRIAPGLHGWMSTKRALRSAPAADRVLTAGEAARSADLRSHHTARGVGFCGSAPHDWPRRNHLTDEGRVDRATLMTGLRMCASIARSPALKDVLGTLARPRGAQDLSDSTLEDSLNTCSRAIYHPVGTCRMARMTPLCWTHSCGFAVSPGTAWPTRR